MRNDTISIKASIRLLSVSEGGRDRTITGSYRPNHNFFEPDNREMAMGFINLPKGQVLRPGETREIVITFAKWPRLEGEIYPGRAWRIPEGARLVGMGTVLDVVANA